MAFEIKGAAGSCDWLSSCCDGAILGQNTWEDGFESKTVFQTWWWYWCGGRRGRQDSESIRQCCVGLERCLVCLVSNEKLSRLQSLLSDLGWMHTNPNYPNRASFTLHFYRTWFSRWSGLFPQRDEPVHCKRYIYADCRPPLLWTSTVKTLS